ncbi:MAG: redox-sensing transcriptional repressor Rex [Lachnospiraceae bacterium]|nr:redox-sensing transcriptional repressor Rex [Lachnospiraceae bacterium]
MKQSKTISKAVISRLPKYYRCLRELLNQNIERVSSEELSAIMKTTASQVRQDLNHFGGFGQQGYGYNVENLYNEIGKILGVEKPHKLILIGAGNLGRALFKFQNFRENGFIFCNIFDADTKLQGKSVNGIPISDVKTLPQYLAENDIDIAVICVPTEAARSIAMDVYDLGIRNFINFAHTDLKLPDDAIVKNIHILDSMLELSYSISTKKNEDLK